MLRTRCRAFSGVGSRKIWEDAAETRSTVVVRRDLPTETDRGCSNKRPAARHGCVVQDVPCSRIVSAINQQIMSGAKLAGHINAHHTFRVRHDFNEIVDVQTSSPKNFGFVPPNEVRREPYLPMQIAHIHCVAINEGEMTDTSSAEVHRYRATKATCANNEDPRFH
eukprot:CAMPEP_0194530646 /NCGR_PEP_ID=MMETSP0253-20130528/67664_1 /TAXON_ID=2966 /ORGANISM="Noctiluca scintillans" /LENGTH=165 /DNA_ID=CAMNT_0039375907 /DNA_START=629 /DNA_END=1126 /DNA_ORIENTATION=+